MATSSQTTRPEPSGSPSSVRPQMGHGRTATNTARLPPPTLFKGPPSKNASHISLVLPDESQRMDQDTGRTHGIPRPSRIPPAMSFSGASFRNKSIQADEFRAESHWAEMQKTLADVELSAMNPSPCLRSRACKGTRGSTDSSALSRSGMGKERSR